MDKFDIFAVIIFGVNIWGGIVTALMGEGNVKVPFVAIHSALGWSLALLYLVETKRK